MYLLVLKRAPYSFAVARVFFFGKEAVGRAEVAVTAIQPY